MKFQNLTPHVLGILTEGSLAALELPASGQVARVAVTRTQADTLGGVAIFST